VRKTNQEGSKRKKKVLHMVVHTCNSNTQEAEKEGHKFKANLGYLLRDRFRHLWLPHIIPAIWEAEVRRLEV
jgi:hypothetical protein